MEFTFQNTTKIIFGENQIAQISNEIPKDKKVLVIYGGGSIKNNGVYDQVSKALSDHKWDEFSGIEANPQYDTLMKAVEKIKKEGFDYLLAVGGGSVIDGTKFISAAALYSGQDPWDILVNQEPISKAIPLSCVLTLPATGSESNAGSVVSRGKEKLFFFSPLCQPKFAALDPATTLSLSQRQIANGVIDAFVHVMEQYLTYPVGAKVQDRFSEGLLLTLLEEGPKALANPENLEIRSNIMWAATLALNGLIGVGVPQDWTSHMIGHEITGNFGIDHARTLSIILPAVMKVCRESKKDKLVQYAERVFKIKNEDADKSVDKAIDLTIKFFQEMSVPTSLSDVDLGEKDIETILSTLEKHGRIALGEHGNTDIEKSREILNAAL